MIKTIIKRAANRSADAITGKINNLIFNRPGSNKGYFVFDSVTIKPMDDRVNIIAVIAILKEKKFHFSMWVNKIIKLVSVNMSSKEPDLSKGSWLP